MLHALRKRPVLKPAFFNRFESREPLKTMKFEADEQVKSGVYFGK